MTSNDAQSTETGESTTNHPSRRTFLVGAGVVGAVAAAGALAACSDSAGGDTASASGDGQGAAGGGAPTGSDTTSDGGGSGGGTALGSASAIPVGGGKIFDQANVVVTQPTSGEFKAFSATCTHQGCQVNQVRGGVIECPCHGSTYSITDGSVQRAATPGQRALPAKQVTVTDGKIVLG